MTRLVIFTTHPIQYQAPWFRALAKVSELEVEVLFSHVPDSREQGVGFGTAFTWDIPLRDGYASKILESKSLPTFMPGFARRISKKIDDTLDALKPDVALILGWQELSLAQALFACRRRRIPIIMRGESNGLRARPWIVKALHRRYFAACDTFLAIGRANADFYRDAGVRDDQIVMANYFVDNQRFRSMADGLRDDRAKIRESWGIKNSSTCFAFVGKLEPKKRLFDFLGGVDLAVRQGFDVHALVVGTGEQMGQAQSMVAELCLPVTFAGFLNQSEIGRAYVAADCLVLPSDYGETWGLVVNEAMATGIPALVSDRIGAAGDLVIDRLTGRVFPFGDRLALAKALADLTVDAASRKAMGEAAFQRVTSEYTIEKAVEGAIVSIAFARREGQRRFDA